MSEVKEARSKEVIVQGPAINKSKEQIKRTSNPPCHPPCTNHHAPTRVQGRDSSEKAKDQRKQESKKAATGPTKETKLVLRYYPLRNFFFNRY